MPTTVPTTVPKDHNIVFVKASDKGVSLMEFVPFKYIPPGDGQLYISVCKDLTLEIQGDNFLASHKLTVDSALSLVENLTRLIRGVLEESNDRKLAEEGTKKFWESERKKTQAQHNDGEA